MQMQVTKTTIKMDIDERRCLAFDYQSLNDSEPRHRIIHPYVFGRKSNNREFVFGLQVEGGPTPGFRMYGFTKSLTMQSRKVYKNNFQTYRRMIS